MGFFDTLRRVLGGESTAEFTVTSTPEAPREDAEELAETAEYPVGESRTYERSQWQKKLKRILDKLPDSKGEWDDLEADAKALELDPDWMSRAQVEEFMLLIRRAVSDRHFTEKEHRKLDLARELIGIPEAEAEAALRTVLAEAEAFFGKPIKKD